MGFLALDWLGRDLLTTLLVLPTLGAVLLAAVSAEAERTIKGIALAASGLTLGASVLLAVRFDPATPGLEGFRVYRPWIPRLGIHYELGVDGLAVALVLLTTLLTFCVLLVACGQHLTRLKGYMAAFLVLETGDT